MAGTTIAPVLTDDKTLKEVVNCLTEHLPITMQGKCNQQTIFEILIRAASQKDSIENTSKVLKDVPTSNDIRYHLEKYKNLASLESDLNQALQNGKRGSSGREFFVYAVHKVQLSLHLIHDDYRLRFGIESSYRLKNQCRIKTTIKNPIIMRIASRLSV